MSHKPLDQLQSELEIAKTAAVIGSDYAHYKHPDKPYVVLDLVITEADDRVAVLYCQKGNENIKFVRPLSSWVEEVEVDGQMVPRFRMIS
jgi:hypothetical protein